MHFISIEKCLLYHSGQYMELKVLISRSGWYADKNTPLQKRLLHKENKVAAFFVRPSFRHKHSLIK